ncbi:hypothetical protein [Streptomyces canus]|uniref:hypothetical protein n=1 Tax=Streptomyces canus TaxID=58343 RepID=UPI001319EEDA|nr:hypothetical protein [Streptomyces canus]
MTTSTNAEPRSITEYRAITASPIRHDGRTTPQDDDVRIVQEFRGRRRSLVTLGDPGVKQAPRVSVRYPGDVRSPETWMALLPDAESLEVPGPRPPTWPDMLSAATEDEWRRCLATVAGQLRLPRSEDPSGDGLGRSVERAAYALLGAILHEPDSAIVRPTTRLSALSSADGQRCPAWAGSARWTRPGEEGRSAEGGRVRPCGCDGDSPCLWAWAETHYPESPPARDWDTLRLLVADSPLMKAVRALGVPQRAQNAGKGRPPRTERGLWSRAVQEWGFQGAMTSRVYAVPAFTVMPAARWLVNGNRRETALTEVFGYLDDIHIDNLKLAGPDGGATATSIRDNLRRWASVEPLRETAVMVALIGVWNTFLDITQRYPGRRPGGPAAIPRYGALSCGERKLILAVDTCLPHLAAAYDADERSLDDLAISQTLNGYSDLSSDMALGVVNNGLILGAGPGALPGGADAEGAYRALSRSMLAIARSGANRPGAEAVSNTVIWNIINGRHNIVERAAGVPYEWMARKWPVLEENRREWDAVEEELCTRVYAALARDDVRLKEKGQFCPTCGDLPRWSGLMHDLLDDVENAACALTQYILCERVYAEDLDGEAANGTPASDCAGAVGILIRRFESSGLLNELSWILAGAIWFREALHLRGCVVDLAFGLSDDSGGLAPDDW